LDDDDPFFLRAFYRPELSLKEKNVFFIGQSFHLKIFFFVFFMHDTSLCIEETDKTVIFKSSIFHSKGLPEAVGKCKNFKSAP
jgi:hypothetical protein